MTIISTECLYEVTTISKRPTDNPLTHVMDNTRTPGCVTIDVEEYYHIEAAHGAMDRSQWWSWPTRVERQIEGLLALFAEHDARGTFFMLGDVVKRCPGLARRIADAGHELASHGTNHDRLHRMDPTTLLADLVTSKRLIEDETGQAVVGYRAPSFSLTRETAWAVDVIRAAGFEYDSSIFPVYHPSYGVPEAPDRPFYVRGDGENSLLAIPPLTWSPGWAGGKKLAVAGGGYFRLLPLGLMRRGLRTAKREGRPAVLYFHPWEFDADLPRMPLSRVNRLRTYTGLGRATARLDRILTQGSVGRGGMGWKPMGEMLDQFRAIAGRGELVELGTGTGQGAKPQAA